MARWSSESVVDSGRDVQNDAGRPRLSGAARGAVLLVRAYQLTLSPIFAGSCRFEPSCSRYAVEALSVHGFWRGGALALRRLGRCHPLGRAGFDPVPGPRTR